MSRENIEDEIRMYIVSELLEEDANDVDLPSDTPLMTGFLDSFATLQLVTFLEDRFGLGIATSEMVDENFGTIASVAAMVERKLSTAA
jgi:acyl carrier protein